MEQNWGLVFGGGGAKGAYQIGVWKALKELEMEAWITGMAGASIGSLNAALFACGDYERAEAAWKQVNMLSVFDTDWALIDGKEGTFSREEMLHLIRGYVDFGKITGSSRPIFCSVSKVLPEREYAGMYMRLDGKTAYSIEQLLAASSALPYIHEAVEYEGAYYRDGGLTDNLPIRPLYEMGFRHVLVVGLSENARQFEKQFPDVEFLSVYPSHSLGNLIDGTLNFRQQFITFAQRLGYKDGMRIFRHYLHPEETMLSMQQLAELDLQEIMADMRREELQSGVDEHMNKLNDIIKTYGADK